MEQDIELQLLECRTADIRLLHQMNHSTYGVDTKQPQSII
jgi:hypothetical protein